MAFVILILIKMGQLHGSKFGIYLRGDLIYIIGSPRAVKITVGNLQVKRGVGFEPFLHGLRVVLNYGKH
jgi:hypothetical protein